MRQIALGPIFVVVALLSVALGLTLLTSGIVLAPLPWGEFWGVALVITGVLVFVGWCIVVYRLFLWVMPLQTGDIAPNSRAEFVAHVYNLFYYLVFNTLIRANFLPIPLLRLVYIALGTQMGSNSYSGGAILDPPLTRIGRNCIIGHNAVVFSHAIEGDRFSLSPVVIGDNVTIGAMAVVMSGVVIGDGAIVSAGAVVLKDTRIGAGEVWGGVPAKKLRDAEPQAEPQPGRMAELGEP